MSELTVADIRELKRQLVSREIKPVGNPPVFWFVVSEEAAALYFITRNFPSWLVYV